MPAGDALEASCHALACVSALECVHLADGSVLYRVDGDQLVAAVGAAGAQGCEDGAAGQGRLDRIAGMAADGQLLYAFDEGCHALRTIDLASGRISTLAGSPQNPVFAPGDGSAAGLNSVDWLAFDAASQTLYGLDRRENIVLEFTAASP